MKFIFFLFLIPCLVHAQSDSLHSIFPWQGGRVVYERIIDVKEVSKDRLFSNIKQWSVKSYSSQKNALETEDKERGYIVYKGFLPVMEKLKGGPYKGRSYEVRVYHTLNFYIKDEKVRVVLSDLGIQNMLLTYIIAGADTPRDPVEQAIYAVNKKVANSPKRKADKIQQGAKELYQDINHEVGLFMDSVENYLKSDKSGFDF